MDHDRTSRRDPGERETAAGVGSAPGKRTLTTALGSARAAAAAAGDGDAVQRRAAPGATPSPAAVQRMLDEALRPDLFASPVQRAAGPAAEADLVHAAAAHGTSGAGGPLPYLDVLQPLFGAHHLGGIVAHTDGAAQAGAEQMGAAAFATGNHVAFAGAPSLHTAAHEAAHVVQQRSGVQLKGGVGDVGDAYEQHADAVADAVVAGRSAAPLLDAFAGPATAGAAPSAGPVQRYTIEHGLKVSAGANVAIENQSEPQRFFAKPEVVERSNAILAALKSRLKLVVGNETPDSQPAMRAVTPTKRQDDRALFDVNECVDVADRVTGSNQTHAIYQSGGGRKTLQRQSPYDLASINRLVEALTKQDDVTPSRIITAQDGDDNAETFDFDLSGTVVSTDSAGTANNAIKNQIPNRNLRVALLLNTLRDKCERMPDLQQQVIDRLAPLLSVIEVKVTEEKSDTEVEQWAAVLNGVLADIRNENSKAYGEMDDEERSERAQQVGVNEYARPDVGESYGILSSRDRRKDELGDKWSFHFAAVIARDGDDSVTLENYNRMKGDEGNAEWYFDMQGAEDQSFHAKHEDTVADGVTVRFGAPASEDDKQQLLELVSARYQNSPMMIAFRVRIQRAQTRAELAAIQVDALGG